MLKDAKNMVSPFTGGKVTLNWEYREVEFRKEKFKVMFPFYRCEDTKEQYTTTESDGVWYTQMRNQYCHKYGIPFTDEIIAIRKHYGLSAIKMSLILGFGENQWRRYEQEEVPSLSNGKMIRSIMDPNVFLNLVESSKELLTAKEYKKITAHINEIIADETTSKKWEDKFDAKRIFSTLRGEDNGYAPLSLQRLKNIILILLQQCGDTFCTKMNKLLFFADFISYRERGIAMTGLSYRALDYGPAPVHWDRVYSQFNEIKQEPRFFGDFEGCVLTTTVQPNEALFSPIELEILNAICQRFKALSSSDISFISHEEDAWLENQVTYSRISFKNAFTIKAI